MGILHRIAAAGIVMGAAAPVVAQTVPADKPELELLDFWSLNTTLPTGTDYTDSLDISVTGLDTYQDSNFRIVTGGGVSMRARFGGAVTSSGTAFSRTELREMASASTKAAWACKTKAKEMTAKLRIKATPHNRPAMSVAQIHDDSSDVLEVQYVYAPALNGGAFPAPGALGDVGTIIASWNGGAATSTLDAAYVVGDTIIVTVKVNGTLNVNGYPGAGSMKVEYTNVTQSKTGSASQAIGSTSGGCYFKAGNYHQACSKLFLDGTSNATCAAKHWPLSTGFTWEDPASASATSELILYQLSVTPKGN